MDVKEAISSTSELLFDFASSIVLLPRTLAKVLRNPVWAVDYLTSQSSEKAKERFEKYSHPILFWIVMGIIPYYAIIEIYFQSSTEGKVLEAYNNIGAVNIISSIAIFLVSFPLSCSFILHVFRHRNFTKTTFRRSFFIQLYITAPVQLFYVALLNLDEPDDWLIPFIFLGLASVFWFLIAEMLIIRKETGYNWPAAFSLLVLMYLIFFVFAAICMSIFFLINMGHFQKLVDAYFGDLDIPPEQ